MAQRTSPLAQLLEDEIKDIYDAEKQLTKALPKLARKASSAELKEAIQGHLRETEGQIERLERVFEQLDMPVPGKKCKGMEYLLEEGNEMVSEVEDDDARDAAMICSAQKVEHYEIASYGTARTWAGVLGHSEVVSLLEESLEEEKAADSRLTDIAESFVNVAAASGEDAEGQPERASSGSLHGGSGRRPRHQAADRRGRSKDQGRGR